MGLGRPITHHTIKETGGPCLATECEQCQYFDAHDQQKKF